MIKPALEKIGLTEGEIHVYLALTELGLSTSWNITKNAKIASSKVYEVLQRLIDKGLVSFVIKNGVRYYDATPPERLLDFLEEKQNEIEITKKGIRDILPELKSRKGTHEENKTIVYTGTQGPKIVLKEAIEAGRNGQELYGFGTDEDPYLIYFPFELKRHFEEQKKYKIRWKLLFTKGFKSPNPFADIRYLPEGFSLPVRTMIYGNKVAIVDFHKPFTTIIIENKKVAESYREHFNVLWKIAKK